MSERLDAEHRYENHARHDTECGGVEVPWGGAGDAEQTDGDEPLPRGVVRKEASHCGF